MSKQVGSENESLIYGLCITRETVRDSVKSFLDDVGVEDVPAEVLERIVDEASEKIANDSLLQLLAEPGRARASELWGRASAANIEKVRETLLDAGELWPARLYMNSNSR